MVPREISKDVTQIFEKSFLKYSTFLVIREMKNFGVLSYNINKTIESSCKKECGV